MFLEPIWSSFFSYAVYLRHLRGFPRLHKCTLFFFLSCSFHFISSLFHFFLPFCHSLHLNNRTFPDYQRKKTFFSFKDRVSRSNPHQHILLFSFFPFSEQSSTSSRPYECNAFCANTVLNIILFDTCSVTMGVPWQVKSSTSSLGRYISLRID